MSPITSKSKSDLSTQLLHNALTLAMWVCGSLEGSLENKPLAVSRGKTSARWSLLCCHSLYSMLRAVEREFVPSVGVHSENRVTTEHEHQSELGCFGLDHHH